jgi:hypothetical protein
MTDENNQKTKLENLQFVTERMSGRKLEVRGMDIENKMVYVPRDGGGMVSHGFQRFEETKTQVKQADSLESKLTIHEGDDYICILKDGEYDNTDNPLARVANMEAANLFVAAPELLEACKAVHEYFKACAKDYIPDENTSEDHMACHATENSEKLQILCNDAGVKIVTAIAKAEGRE